MESYAKTGFHLKKKTLLGEFGEEFPPGSELQDQVNTSGDFNNLDILMVIAFITNMVRVNLIESDKVWMRASIHHSDFSEKHLK